MKKTLFAAALAVFALAAQPAAFAADKKKNDADASRPSDDEEKTGGKKRSGTSDKDVKEGEKKGQDQSCSDPNKHDARTSSK